MSIGSKIRCFRQEKGLTSKKLANLIGVHPKTITAIERNKQKTFRPTLFAILCKIACCFNVEWEILADDYVLSIYGDCAERIKKYLHDNNMSQIELSRLLSVHEQTIALWIKQKDKPSRKSWELLKKYGII